MLSENSVETFAHVWFYVRP